MNIVYVLNSTIPNGGATKAFINMLTGLIYLGVHPFVIVPDVNGIYQSLKEKKISVIAIPYRSCAYPRLRILKDYFYFIPKLIARIIINKRAEKQLAKLLIKEHIDLVHTNVGIISIGYRASRKAKIPHIYHIREYGDIDFGIHYYPNKTAFWKQLKSPNSYSICITKGVQEYHQQKGKSTSRVIYDGVFPFKSQMPKEDKKNYFLFAGRIQYAKGVDELLVAYKTYFSLSKHPLHLLIAGDITDPIYYKQQKRFIEEHKLNEYITFLGEVDNITALMKQARALIVSSRNEGFGFCMPEAMQQGCLTIAHNTGGTKEQLDNAFEIVHREIALRYETTEDLSHLLAEVERHSINYYKSYIEQAFLVVNKLYTNENNYQQVFNFYNDIRNDCHH